MKFQKGEENLLEKGKLTRSMKNEKRPPIDRLASIDMGIPLAFSIVLHFQESFLDSKVLPQEYKENKQTVSMSRMVSQ